MEEFPKKIRAKKWIALVIGEPTGNKHIDDGLTSDFIDLPSFEQGSSTPKAPYVDSIAMTPNQEFQLGQDCGDLAYYTGLSAEVFKKELEDLIKDDAIEIIE